MLRENEVRPVPGLLVAILLIAAIPASVALIIWGSRYSAPVSIMPAVSASRWRR